jgi:glycosyltransferase involved in cell wall biosynthesis
MKTRQFPGSEFKYASIMKALKICIFTETYCPEVGGGETQARALAEGLVANGFSVMVFTRRSKALSKKVESYGPITVYRLPPVGNNHLNKWGLVLTSLALFFKLRQQYDLIFVSGFRVIGVSAILMSRLFNKSCILKADSMGEMSGEFFVSGLARLHLAASSRIFRLLLALRNKFLRNANCFIAISSAVARELLYSGINSEFIKIIPNSVDTSKFFPVSLEEKRKLRHQLGLPAKDRIFIFTGRLVSYKGLPLLLEVWRKFWLNHSKVKLYLVGPGGLDINNCEADLKSYVKKNGLQDSVYFTGAVHNVNEYLQASDIFVFPTENEAFGISVIEAMACGLPVISTYVGGLKDIVYNRKNGLVIKSGDFEQLYEALDLIITENDLSDTLGAAAWQTVQSRYSTATITQKYLNLFRGLG